MASYNKPRSRGEIVCSAVSSVALLLIATGGLYLGCWFMHRFVTPDEWYPSLPNFIVGMLGIAIFSGLPLALIAYIWCKRPFYWPFD